MKLLNNIINKIYLQRVIDNQYKLIEVLALFCNSFLNL